MAVAAEHDMDILQLDVQTAYLQSPVEEDVYVKPAPGYESQGNVMKLNVTLWPTSIRQKWIRNNRSLAGGHRIHTN